MTLSKEPLSRSSVVSGMRDLAYYREKAARFRELAAECDVTTASAMIMLAEEYEAEARQLDPTQPPQRRPE